jgi:hypothetical protein
VSLIVIHIYYIGISVYWYIGIGGGLQEAGGVEAVQWRAGGAAGKYYM